MPRSLRLGNCIPNQGMARCLHLKTNLGRLPIKPSIWIKTGNKIARSSHTVTTLPDVEVFASIRLNHVSVAITRTNPRGSFDPPNPILTQTRNLARPAESSFRSESGLQNNMWILKTINPRMYMLMNPTGLGDLVRSLSPNHPEAVVHEHVHPWIDYLCIHVLGGFLHNGFRWSLCKQVVKTSPNLFMITPCMVLIGCWVLSTSMDAVWLLL